MIIIHGDDAIGSYKRLNEVMDDYKNRNFRIIFFDASDLDVTTLRQETSSDTLFGENKIVIIKNLLGGSKSKQKEALVTGLSNISGIEVILYEPKKITEAVLKAFPSAKKETYNINPVIFKYMDMIKPGNTRNLLSGWTRLLQLDHAPEYVFTMIVRQIRLLIQAKSGPSYLKLAPYPKRLISAQANYFSLDHLLELHQALFDIDVKIKTGSSPLDLNILMTRFLMQI